VPRHTAKPCFRIDKDGDEWVITLYRVVNRNRVPAGSFRVAAFDREALAAELLPRYAALRERPTRQEN